MSNPLKGLGAPSMSPGGFPKYVCIKHVQLEALFFSSILSNYTRAILFFILARQLSIMSWYIHREYCHLSSVCIFEQFRKARLTLSSGHHLSRCSTSCGRGISKNRDLSSWGNGLRRDRGWNGGSCATIGGKGSSTSAAGTSDEIPDYTETKISFMLKICANGHRDVPWLVLPVVHWYVWGPLSPWSRHWSPPVMAIRLSGVRYQLVSKVRIVL